MSVGAAAVGIFHEAAGGADGEPNVAQRPRLQYAAAAAAAADDVIMMDLLLRYRDAPPVHPIHTAARTAAAEDTICPVLLLLLLLHENVLGRRSIARHSHSHSHSSCSIGTDLFGTPSLGFMSCIWDFVGRSSSSSSRRSCTCAVCHLVAC